MTFVRNAFSQNHHFASSCRMRATKLDPVFGDGVVDAFGNVFDTRNVMVCDVSAFPNIGDSSPAGVCYAFALKIAEDLITGRNPKA